MKKKETLLEIVKKIKQQPYKKDFLNHYTPKAMVSYSNKEVVEMIENIAFGLLAKGVKKGDAIGLLSISSPKWTIFDFAIMAIGAKVVPLFDTASKAHTLFQLRDAEVDKIFVSSIGYNEKFDEIFNSEKIEMFSFADEGNLPNVKKKVDIAKLIEQGKKYKLKEKRTIDDLIDEVKEDDIVTLVYTSGTTGNPKGVILNHRNFISQIEGFDPRFSYLLKKVHKRVACILPLAHIYQRTVNYFFLYKNSCMYYMDPKDLTKGFPKVKPQVTVVVPRLLEKVYDKLMLKKKQETGVAKFLLTSGLNRGSKKDIEASRDILDFIYDRLVYKKIRKTLGGKLELMVSGGARISDDIFKLFINAGLPVQQGYGLTETSPVISTSYKKNIKVGSVGQLLKGVEVSFSDIGEILVKGDLVMQGYHKNAKETKASFKDGWFLTGDLGHMDEDGYLFITGRRKELLKASNGKYIAPIPIEAKIVENGLLEYALIIADGVKFISVLLFPDFENLKENKKHRHLEHLNNEEFFNEESVQKEIKSHIDKINLELSPWEKISRSKVIVSQLTIDGGELTPKFSVKRNVVKEKYQSYIDEIYKKHS